MSILTGSKPHPFTVVYGDERVLLDPSFDNEKKGVEILFGKSRLLELMSYPEVYGFRVHYFQSDSEAYAGQQVVFVAVGKDGLPLLDIATAYANAPEEVHGSIWGIGMPQQPGAEAWSALPIDWGYIYLLVRQELLNAEMLKPDAGCPDCGPWDDGYFFP